MLHLQGLVTDHLVLRGWFQTLPIAIYGYRLAVTPEQQVSATAVFTSVVLPYTEFIRAQIGHTTRVDAIMRKRHSAL